MSKISLRNFRNKLAPFRNPYFGCQEPFSGVRICIWVLAKRVQILLLRMNPYLPVYTSQNSLINPRGSPTHSDFQSNFRRLEREPEMTSVLPQLNIENLDIQFPFLSIQNLPELYFWQISMLRVHFAFILCQNDFNSSRYSTDVSFSC